MRELLSNVLVSLVLLAGLVHLAGWTGIVVAWAFQEPSAPGVVSALWISGVVVVVAAGALMAIPSSRRE